MDPKQVVLQFVAAIANQQIEDARALLADRGFQYVGPNMRMGDPDQLAGFLLSMGSILKKIEIQDVIAEGDRVCVTLDYRTYFEPIGDVRIAVLAAVEGGRIGRLEAFYNAAVVEGMLNVDGQ